MLEGMMLPGNLCISGMAHSSISAMGAPRTARPWDDHVAPHFILRVILKNHIPQCAAVL